MDIKSSKVVYPLLYKNVYHHAEEIDYYINSRRKRSIKSLQTRWNRFNNLCMGGIEPNTILTIAGISGSGKSSFVNSLQTDLFDLNPDIDFVVLSFTFEMIASRNVGRTLSYKLKKTVSELYSVGEIPLSDNEYDRVQNELTKIKQLPIYYVDNPGTVEQIRETILRFSEREGKDKWVIVILDHTLLTKGTQGEDERITLSNLQRMFIEMKKYGKTTIIQLSQMNRNIESVDRITNKSMHFPMRNDIFGGDSVMQASDIVLVLHRPELLGIINCYGPRNLPTEGLIYMHLIKNREGEAGIVIPFENNLKYNRLDETTISEKFDNSEEIKVLF